eukprot:2869670-Lingulodinium_polyedra.AAC.1
MQVPPHPRSHEAVLVRCLAASEAPGLQAARPALRRVPRHNAGKAQAASRSGPAPICSAGRCEPGGFWSPPGLSG